MAIQAIVSDIACVMSPFFMTLSLDRLFPVETIQSVIIYVMSPFFMEQSPEMFAVIISTIAYVMSPRTRLSPAESTPELSPAVQPPQRLHRTRLSPAESTPSSLLHPLQIYRVLCHLRSSRRHLHLHLHTVPSTSQPSTSPPSSTAPAASKVSTFPDNISELSQYYPCAMAPSAHPSPSPDNSHHRVSSGSKFLNTQKWKHKSHPFMLVHSPCFLNPNVAAQNQLLKCITLPSGEPSSSTSSPTAPPASAPTLTSPASAPTLTSPESFTQSLGRQPRCNQLGKHLDSFFRHLSMQSYRHPKKRPLTSHRRTI